MKKFFTLAIMAMIALTSKAADSWTIVGASAIMNGSSSWVTTETANDMTSSDGDTYTLTVEGLTVEAGTYEYKVCADHAWNESYPTSGNNALTISETAVYTIVYKFVYSTLELTATATKTGEAGEVSHIYSIAGDPSTIFGATWDQTNTGTEMSKNDEGIYTWTSEAADLTEGQTIQFKVVQDHDWGVAYPSSNYSLSVDADGTYTLTVTFNPTTKEVTATLNAVTGISTIENAKAARSIYDLMGRKQAKLNSGISIVNGVKVLVK